MSTHSTIGYETPAGGYIGVYCHYDGYPGHMIPELSQMTCDEVRFAVTAGLFCGGLRCINDGIFEAFKDSCDPNNIIVKYWPASENVFNYRKRIDGSIECYSDGKHIDIKEFLSGVKHEDV